ncbi:tetratricopeptide repeat protein, partial [Escherichia coli]
MGRYEDAAAAYEKGLKLDPQNPSITSALQNLRLKLGNQFSDFLKGSSNAGEQGQNTSSSSSTQVPPNPLGPGG